ncbi:MAG TPA: hypothetical protein VGH10_06205 [Actinomycetota bacterium]
MRRIKHLVPLALACLLASGCGLSSAVHLTETAGAPDPHTAILLSILGGSVSMVDPNSGAIEPIATGLTDFQSGYATWAPSHAQLAYGSAGIAVVQAGSNKTRWLVRGQSLSMPAWSPDGRSIVYGNGLVAWVTRAARNNPDRILDQQDLGPFGFDWSSKNVIAFEGLALNCDNAEGCFSTNQSDIWTMRPTGSGLHQITKLGTASNPKWSPDSTKIMFIRTVTEHRKQQAQLWLVPASGGHLQHLVPAVTNVLAADWAPSGARIAIVRQGIAPGTVDLWIANADGSGLHAIATSIPGTDATVDW